MPENPAATDDLPVLYTKAGCPWCEQAISRLDGWGIPYRLKQVSGDPAAFEEMRRKSGQSLTPTLDWHGRILADFGPPELAEFLRAQNVRTEDS